MKLFDKLFKKKRSGNIGKELLEVFGLEGQRVFSLNLHVAVNQEPVLTVERFLDDTSESDEDTSESDTCICTVLKQYRLVPIKADK